MRCLVISQAKSGSSAMMVMVANAIGTTEIYIEPAANTLHDLPPTCVVKVLYENTNIADLMQILPQFQRVILLLRDPRDNLVSRILYTITARKQLLGDDQFLDHFLSVLEQKQADPASIDLLAIFEMINKENYQKLQVQIKMQERYMDFVEQRPSSWYLMYYEDMVAGNLQELSAYIGHQAAPVDMPARWQRVTRTKSSGDWRQWLTNNDVQTLHPYFSPLLLRMGYEDEWQLATRLVIRPEHCQDYVLRLIHEIRKTQSLPPYTPRCEREHVAALMHSCNICGHTRFGAGPNGRKAGNGMLPACLNCGALERQRAVRCLMQALPLDFLSWRRSLQIRNDAGIASKYFASHTLMQFDASDSSQLAKLSAADGSYDFIYLNYVLEFVPNDVQVFDELLRVLSARGIFLINFIKPQSREQTEAMSTNAAGQHRTYGKDLVQHFAGQHLAVAAVELRDPCTGMPEVLHWFCKAEAEKERLLASVLAWHRDQGSALKVVFDSSKKLP